MSSVLWQPYGGRFGDWLIDQLNSNAWTDAYLFSAFARSGGLEHLKASLATFRKSGGISRAWVGVDVQGTSIEALKLLKESVDQVFVVHNPGPSTYHPKVYAFGRRGAWVIAVGSNNLTTGGLFLNIEAAAFLEFVGEETQPAVLSSVLNSIPANNVRMLTDELLGQLIEAGLIREEADLPSSQDEPKVVPAPGTAPFSKTPVLPPPSLPRPPKKTIRVGKAAATGIPEAFVMTLGTRDVRQRKSYSREVYIPLAARDAEPDFWRWPTAFQNIESGTIGTFTERRVNLQIHPVNAPAAADERRLYFYKERSEFRLNAGPLIAGANVGDVLVVERSRQDGIEYDATIVAKGASDYQKWLSIASQEAQSGKRWGYA